MKKIIVVYFEELGEIEAVFDTEDNLLGSWSCNDASWRNEYFSPFLNKLGINIIEGEPTPHRTTLVENHWGLSDDDTNE